MKKEFILSEYTITSDPSFLDDKYEIPPRLKRQFESLYFESLDDKNKKIIDKLHQLIDKYPKAPQLVNYLSTAYTVRGEHEKAKEINNQLLITHPDYLFAKLNKARELILDEEYKKARNILGDSMDLKELYPERQVFHITEITSFLKITIVYFLGIDEIEAAENRLALLQELAADDSDTEDAKELIMSWIIKKGTERFEEEEKDKMRVTVGKKKPFSNLTATPLFHHDEINTLYQYGPNLPTENIKAILALPRATLIEDLENVLNDGIERYLYFSTKNHGWEETFFVLHAFFLLTELKAAQSLPKLLTFLEYDDDFLDFWFGDHITEHLWICFYFFGYNDSSILKDFLIQPGVYTYVKTSVSEGLTQTVIHHPEKRNEIGAVYSEVLRVFADANQGDNLIDSDFLGLMVGDIIDCDFFNLRPAIKILYDKKYVSIDMTGPFTEVERAFVNRRNSKREIKDIFELYTNIANNWAAYQEEDRSKTYPLNSLKIRRNDPCPCASGKKYKRCCLNA